MEEDIAVEENSSIFVAYLWGLLWSCGHYTPVCKYKLTGGGSV